MSSWPASSPVHFRYHILQPEQHGWFRNHCWNIFRFVWLWKAFKGNIEYIPASFQDSRFVVLDLRLTGKHSNHSMSFLVDGIFQVLSVTIASSGVNCVGYFCPRVPFTDTFITSSHFSLIGLLPVMYSNTTSLLVEPHCVHCWHCSVAAIDGWTSIISSVMVCILDLIITC